MHELALAQSVIDLATEHAKSDAFVRVRSIRLEVGALSHVDPGALEFAFEAVAKGTIADGATLTIDRPKALGVCIDCSAAVEMTSYGAPCPACGSYRLHATSGGQMRVVFMEVE